MLVWLAGLLWLDVGRPDHLAPLLGFVGNEFAEVGGRASKHTDAHVGEPPLQLGIGERRIHFLVELLDDLSGRVPWRAQTPHSARFISRNKFADTRQVR